MGGSIILAAFDLILAVVPLKVALGLVKIDFACQVGHHEMPKNQIFKSFNGTTVMGISKAAQKIDPPI